MKLKRSLPLAILLPLTSMVPLTSCGAFSSKWNFLESTNGGTEINYCLLIGQNDHSDSIERTRWTRYALKTLDESEETKIRTKDNPNIAKPVDGEITLYPHGKAKTLKVHEIEQMEQKSLAGATWDAITANATAETWIAKHGNKITFFVSNNDGMAEGAYWACNWIKDLPIFGYDANSTTIEKINAGRITGTVDQNASSQAGAMTMILRNMLEDKDNFLGGKTTKAEIHDFGTPGYNPVNYTNDDGKVMWRGFKDQEVVPSETPYGYVNYSYLTWPIEGQKGGSHLGKDTERDILIKSIPITKDNVEEYINPDTGEAKQPKDMFSKELTGIPSGAKHYNICQTYASKSEAYLIATMKPYIDEYAKRLGLDLVVFQGDGTDESVIINQIESYQKPIDAYLINMVKTTATDSYITALAQKAAAAEGKQYTSEGWTDFKDRLNTPVVFWNRQPHTDGGDINKEVMNNKFFKYVYYVGVDAVAGGMVQGGMIRNQIIKWLTMVGDK